MNRAHDQPPFDPRPGNGGGGLDPECLGLLRRRIRARRGADRHWSMRTSELLASSLLRLSAAASRDNGLPTGTSLKGLLHAVADHVVIDRIRRRIVQRRAQAVVEQLARAAEEPSCPQEDADAAEARALLAGALDGLDAVDRAVVCGRLRGHGWSQVAADVGLSESTTRRRWSEVRRRLRQHLGRAVAGQTGDGA